VPIAEERKLIKENNITSKMMEIKTKSCDPKYSFRAILDLKSKPLA